MVAMNLHTEIGFALPESFVYFTSERNRVKEIATIKSNAVLHLMYARLHCWKDNSCLVHEYLNKLASSKLNVRTIELS